MPRVTLCQDGIEADLENEGGLWLVFREPDGDDLGRYPIDLSELRAALAGRTTIQVSDGEGRSVNLEGGPQGLKVRVEIRGKGTKACRLDADTVRSAVESLDLGV